MRFEELRAGEEVKCGMFFRNLAGQMIAISPREMHWFDDCSTHLPSYNPDLHLPVFRATEEA